MDTYYAIFTVASYCALGNNSRGILEKINLRLAPNQRSCLEFCKYKFGNYKMGKRYQVKLLCTCKESKKTFSIRAFDEDFYFRFTAKAYQKSIIKHIQSLSKDQPFKYQVVFTDNKTITHEVHNVA